MDRQQSDIEPETHLQICAWVPVTVAGGFKALSSHWGGHTLSPRTDDTAEVLQGPNRSEGSAHLILQTIPSPRRWPPPTKPSFSLHQSTMDRAPPLAPFLPPC